MSLRPDDDKYSDVKKVEEEAKQYLNKEGKKVFDVNSSENLKKVLKLIKREDFKTNINTLIDKLLDDKKITTYFNKEFTKNLREYRGKLEKKGTKIRPDDDYHGGNINHIGGDIINIPDDGPLETILDNGTAIVFVLFGIAIAFAMSQGDPLSLAQVAVAVGGSKHKKRKGRKSKKTKKSMKHKKSMKKKKGRKSMKKKKSMKKRK